MKLCLFEDAGTYFLEPLTFTRPSFSLWCGASTLAQRMQRAVPAQEHGGWIRPLLSEFAKLTYPDWALNDPTWLRDGPVTMANGRWMPPSDFILDTETPHVGVIGNEVAYVVRPSETVAEHDTVADWLSHCQRSLPSRPAPGRMIEFLWDIVDGNGAALTSDQNWFRATRDLNDHLPANTTILGPIENLLQEKTATIEPYVLIDNRAGPVMVDRGAVVHSFSRLEGPCYIGRDTMVMGAKIRSGTTLGPCCRVGGEVEASLVQGYSNKYHEGFLGHSYIGEWVNLAAATQTSDLRNDYGNIRLTVNGQRLATGRTKIGSFIGDHTKTGLGVLLNTGSVIGAFSNLLPSGTLLPQTIPSFTQVQYGQLMERWDLRQLNNTAATVMGRRDIEFTDLHREFYFQLFDATAANRRRVIQDVELRRMKRSV